MTFLTVEKGASVEIVPDGPGFRPETRVYTCADCQGHRLIATRKRCDDGAIRTLYHCWNCYAGARQISEASGIPMGKLLGWPPPDELGPPVRGHGRAAVGNGGGGLKINQASVDGWHSALMANEDVLTWLNERYLLRDDTIRQYRLGYDSPRDGVVIPVFEDGELVAGKIRFRHPAADAPDRLNSGRPARLYPDVPKRGALLFVPGEMDALFGRQWGLPTIAATCGWPAGHMLPRLAGRRVFLLPDVGEEVAAARTASRLREAGAEPIVVVWPAGLPHGTDLTDWARDHNGTRRELIALVNRYVPVVVAA